MARIMYFHVTLFSIWRNKSTGTKHGSRNRWRGQRRWSTMSWVAILKWNLVRFIIWGRFFSDHQWQREPTKKHNLQKKSCRLIRIQKNIGIGWKAVICERSDQMWKNDGFDWDLVQPPNAEQWGTLKIGSVRQKEVR